MKEPLMRKAKGDGIEIQLAVWEGGGKSILAVHGLTANCRCWDVLAGGLSPRHRLIAMDLRGRGLSERPPSGYSIENHCRDISALLDDLGIDTVVMMGHSLGAFISLVYTTKDTRRVERLILVDGGGRLSAAQRERVYAGIKPSLDRLGRAFPSFEHYIDQRKKAPFLNPWPEAMERYYRYEVEELPEGGVRSRILPAHIQEEIENMGRLDVSRYYASVTCQVLILRAPEGMLSKDDILLPEDVVERMTREIPDARCLDLEGTNHYTIIFGENGRRDRAILEFIENDR